MMVNKENYLFKSVSELKQSYIGLNDEADLLNVSIRHLEQSVDFMTAERRSAEELLRKVEEDLKEMRRDGEKQSKHIDELDLRLDAIELR